MAIEVRRSPWQSRFAWRTYVSGFLWAAAILVSRLSGALDQPASLGLRLDPAGLLYLASALIGGANFLGAGFRAAKSLRLDMNFLMSAALLAALVIGEPFEAATLAFLFSMAELLERYAVDRGRRSIARLLELAPDTANRVQPDGTVNIVPLGQLQVGDQIRIRPGDRIPTDGVVVYGASAVNEATITGEPLPRFKQAGDAVFAGTLNVDGALDVSVTTDAAHSTLARIVELIRQAEGRRAPVEQVVKRFARIYTPVVTVVALLVMVLPPLFTTYPFVEWFLRGVTLLVIACPCALVIATPVTVVSALTSAARNGVLIKGGEYLEALGAVRCLAIDKTGTLTTGRFAVIDFHSEAANSRALLQDIVTIEARSEHPLAGAIVRYGETQDIRPGGATATFVAIPGQGLRGATDRGSLVIGTQEFVGPDAAGLKGPAEADSVQVYARSDDGGTAVITLRDQIRTSAPQVLERLRRLGIRPIVMLTGDSAAAAQQIGKLAGVDQVRWRLSPEQKVAAIRELRQQYGSVAMLGDGVNDAPALAEATIGLAMGAAGSAATIETADVALMSDDLSRLPYAVRLARRTRRTIRFNIALALTAKVLLAVGAVAGVVSLAVAVLVGDMGGSLAVTLNALRLARTRPEPN